MSDTSAPQPEAQAGEPAIAAPMRIFGQFVRDLSFEVPNAPDIFSQLRQAGPDISISLDSSARHIEGETFEVGLSFQIEADVAGKKAFILELAYGCVAEVNRQVVPEEHVHPVLLIEVPRQLFPFVRQIIADVTVSGGFPPLLIQVIDFADLYRKKFGAAVQHVTRNGAGQPSVH